MFNPTYPFTKEVLEATVKGGSFYFVRNSYHRSFDHFHENIKGYFIITHYNDEAKAYAHFNSIPNDGNRFLYEWSNEEHKRKLYMAASQPEGYKVYSAYFLPNYKDKITKPLKDKINTYMYKTTNWKPGRGETLSVDLYMQYGSLYAVMSYNTEKIKIKFDEIEKM
ncbi:hypothetical protein [Segetibacter koreensis]|uniref:hypothetical protein n=1 Tax=Segetibacter koreensis TaxID=398037 RepID=UPI00036B5C59|nr:hypothetical protein [Segetibacter koreensis]